MTFGVLVDVPAPADMYRAVSAAVDERLGAVAPEGLLTHVARPTDEGFQVVEVWETREQADRFNDEVLAPIIDRLAQGPGPRPEGIFEEFEVLGLRGQRLGVLAPQQSSHA